VLKIAFGYIPKNKFKIKSGNKEKNSRLVISEKEPNHFFTIPNENFEIEKKLLISPKMTLLYNQSE